MEGITFKLDTGDVYLDINRAIPCGLIVNELISNSLKHAFPSEMKGEIFVKMRVNKRGKHTLIVKDTGVGFPKELDFRKTELLGMRLTMDLVRQLDGTIELDRKEGSTVQNVILKTVARPCPISHLEGL